MRGPIPQMKAPAVILVAELPKIPDMGQAVQLGHHGPGADVDGIGDHQIARPPVDQPGRNICNAQVPQGREEAFPNRHRRLDPHLVRDDLPADPACLKIGNQRSFPGNNRVAAHPQGLEGVHALQAG